MKPDLAFQVMLAGPAPSDLASLQYPLFVSPKLDGVRATVVGGTLMSRAMKPIPNRHAQDLYGRKALSGFDGELVVGMPAGDEVFLRTSGAVRREAGEPDLTFWVFDHAAHGGQFNERYDHLRRELRRHRHARVELVEQEVVLGPDHLLQVEQRYLARGFEGAMLRHPTGPYKFGRSTTREGWLLKLKRFADSEAEVLQVEEEQENLNPQQVNELGRLRRSSHAAGKRGLGTLGALHVRDVTSGVEFSIGSGFSDALRAELWKERRRLVGAVVKYKFFPGGVKERPRFPVFLGLRDDFDR